MRRVLNLSLNQVLLGAVPLCLLFAWLSGHWTLGAAVALGALCALALRNPNLPWLDRIPGLSRLAARPEAPSSRASTTSTTTSIPAAVAPPPRRPAKRNHDAPLVSQMLEQGRVALLLRPQIAVNLSATDLSAAQAELDDTMAIVPQGPVAVRGRLFESHDEEALARAERLVKVEGFFLDRYCVTNRQYHEFVDDGGYEQMSLWEESIWPAVLSFVDCSGQPGPRFWENGTFPHGRDDDPVVGVSWFEACAYARWAGKRLPTDPEWVKVGSWPVVAEGGKPIQRKFPWGDSMDRRKVNIWGSGHNTTVPVHALPESASVNGVHQLVGNVWEWTSSTFGAWEPAGRKIETSLPLKSVRGGAFDTYFDTQSNCQFQSGESPLARKHNIGFRCALGFCDVQMQAGSPLQQEDDTPESPADTHEEVLA
jgi:iron(II)-dependent oxidoreductase